MDRRVTSPTFLFYILLNGDVYEKVFFTENFNTFGRLFKRNPTYCAGSQTCYFWSSKANGRLLAFFAAVNHLNGFKRSCFVICDCWISIRFVCFCVSRFVPCDRNYDWHKRKTQLWRRLLNFRVRLFVKRAVNSG